MSMEILIADIEAFGPNSKLWSSAARNAMYDYADHPKVQAALEEATEIDNMLKEWEEHEDGADVREEDGKPKTGTPSAGPEETGHAGGPVVGLGMDDLGEIADYGLSLADALAALAESELSNEPYHVLTRENDAVVTIPADPSASTEQIENAIGSETRVMAKELQRLIAARSLSVNQGGLRRGKINPSSLYRMEVGDDRVFRKKVEGQTMDVAVSLVVDQSGSMNGSGKHRTAMESAYAFADVLDRLGVKCEVLGFTTHYDLDWKNGDRSKLPRTSWNGDQDAHHERASEMAKAVGCSSYEVRWEPLFIPVWKTFGERFGLEQRKRMATCYSPDWAYNRLYQNVDGESIRIAAGRLLQQKAKRKIMMVFSDGSPCSDSCSSKLAADLSRAVKEIEKSGIEVIGVGIMDTSAAHYYPKSVTVRSVKDLSTVVMGELKKLLLK